MQEPTPNIPNLEAGSDPGGGGGLDIPGMVENFGTLIYVAIGILAIWGVYNAILIYRTLGKRGIPTQEADALVGQVRDLVLNKSNPQGAIEVCQAPVHWHSSLAQLMAMALRNRAKGLAKIKQLMVLEFHAEVISTMENRLASIGTASRMGPLLGLLGTVMSMIAAFARMGQNSKPDPAQLAGSISLGLWTTAAGLIIATPLMTIANDIQARMRKFRDRTERQLQDFVEIFEQAEAGARKGGRTTTAAR